MITTKEIYTALVEGKFRPLSGYDWMSFSGANEHARLWDDTGDHKVSVIIDYGYADEPERGGMSVTVYDENAEEWIVDMAKETVEKANE